MHILENQNVHSFKFKYVVCPLNQGWCNINNCKICTKRDLHIILSKLTVLGSYLDYWYDWRSLYKTWSPALPFWDWLCLIQILRRCRTSLSRSLCFFIRTIVMFFANFFETEYMYCYFFMLGVGIEPLTSLSLHSLTPLSQPPSHPLCSLLLILGCTHWSPTKLILDQLLGLHLFRVGPLAIEKLMAQLLSFY